MITPHWRRGKQLRQGCGDGEINGSDRVIRRWIVNGISLGDCRAGSMWFSGSVLNTAMNTLVPVHTSTAICNYGSSVGVLLLKVNALYLPITAAAAA